MKSFNRQQTTIILSQTPQEFQEKLNTTLAEMAASQHKYELIFNHTLGFCAYIVWEEKLQIPETAEDEYRLLGMQFTCGDCPEYMPHQDKRVKYTECGHGVPRCAKGDRACEWFYERLKDGTITPNEN